jgi:deoxyribose-phosphate aldolase
MSPTFREIAQMIDHALLQPTLTESDLESGCRLALAHGVASVCILPYWLSSCARLLAGSDVKASTTIGFPHGGHATAIKLAEAEQALADGGEELDMVVNLSQVLSGSWDYVQREIRDIVHLAHQADATVKVIFENGYLADEHKIRLSRICSDLGADWVKTSTGFGPAGATTPDLELMRSHADPAVQIKAAGGIRDLDTLLGFRALGVSRIGTSQTQAILDEARRRLPS